MKYLLLVVILLVGCRSKKEIDWAFECSQKFPTKTVYIPGKDFYHTDTLKGDCVLVNCDPIILRAKCPPTLTITRTINRVDTLRTPDVARETFLLNQFNASIKANTELINVNSKLVQTAEKNEQNARKARQQRNLLGIGILLSILWSLRKIIAKIISPLL